MTSSERNRARRLAAKAVGTCLQCYQQPAIVGLTLCADCRLQQARYRDRQAGRPERDVAPPIHTSPGAHVQVHAMVVGGSRIDRCLAEAKDTVRRAYGNRRIPSVDDYGTMRHNARSRYDRAVHVEFLRRLAAAGIVVEGA